MHTNDVCVFLKLYSVKIIGNVLSSPSIMKRSVNLLQPYKPFEKQPYNDSGDYSICGFSRPARTISSLSNRNSLKLLMRVLEN